MYLKGSFYILRFLFSNKPIIEIWCLTPKKILKFWLIWHILFMKKSDFSSQQNLQNKSLIVFAQNVEEVDISLFQYLNFVLFWLKCVSNIL
jgi:hypothetical protein